MKIDYRSLAIPQDFQKAFKGSDIRGAFEYEINTAVAYRVAVAFVHNFSLSKVIVARDMRVSSPALHEAFAAGVQDAGADVLDIGLAETPALYYTSGAHNCAGVVITASHNAKGDNGFKLVTAGAVPVTRKTGLAAIRKAIQADLPPVAKKRGKRINKNILPEYIKYVVKKVPVPKNCQPLKVVIDAGNGMASLALEALAKKIPLTIEPLFYELDGTFPNRASNPTLAKNQKAIIKKLKEGNYDFGVAFDGDADRLAFFDEHGRYINSAHIGALLATQMLEETPASKFIYTVFTSRRYQEAVEENGGKAYKARVGHAYIKQMMRKHDAIFSCEHSAHFYFKDNYYADSGLFVLLYLVRAYQKARASDMSFTELLLPYTNYFQTEEVMVEVNDKDAVLAAVAKEYEAASSVTVTKFDGVSMKAPEYWFSIKKSVTEDVLKFVVEAPIKKTALAKQKEVKALLQSLD